MTEYAVQFFGPEPSVGDMSQSLSALANITFRPECLVISPEVAKAYVVVRCSFGVLRSPEEHEDRIEQIVDESKLVNSGQRMTITVTPRDKTPAAVRFEASIVGPAVNIDADTASRKAAMLGIA